MREDDVMPKTPGVTLARKTLIGALFIVVGILAFVGVQAQWLGSQREPKLTAEDREEIRGLMHRYMFYLDNCPGSNNGRDFADLFTEDGQFMVAAGQLGWRKGRETLANSPGGGLPDGSCIADRSRGPENEIHLNIGEIIEPSPEGARATSYLLMINGPDGQPYWAGWYEDIFVRTADGWRFKQRIHVGRRTAGGADAPVSRDPVKWVDGFDNRANEDQPGFALPPGGGRQGGRYRPSPPR